VTSQALLITGAPGAGKSTLLNMLSTLLEIDGMTFGAVECDELARGWPYPSLLEVLPRLAAVTALQRQAGRALILVVATTEDDSDLQLSLRRIDAVIDSSGPSARTVATEVLGLVKAWVGG
jgi:energy-coupling factor transporter ATP-binding protein EcfA2